MYKRKDTEIAKAKLSFIIKNRSEPFIIGPTKVKYKKEEKPNTMPKATK